MLVIGLGAHTYTSVLGSSVVRECSLLIRAAASNFWVWGNLCNPSNKDQLLTLPGSVNTARFGRALVLNSSRYFMSSLASRARIRRLLELSSWSPRCTTLVATYVMRSSNIWNSWKASCIESQIEGEWEKGGGGSKEEGAERGRGGEQGKRGIVEEREGTREKRRRGKRRRGEERGKRGRMEEREGTREKGGNKGEEKEGEEEGGGKEEWLWLHSSQTFIPCKFPPVPRCGHCVHSLAWYRRAPVSPPSAGSFRPAPPICEYCVGT